jgi:signal transduction histidine kinase
MAAQIKSFDTIKTNKMFKKVPPGDIKLKVTSTGFIEKKEGDILFQAGDAGENIYLILSGDIKMKLPTLSGPRIERRGAGEFIGEIEFFEGTARTSAAVAETNCIIYPLTRKEINDLIAKNRTILNNLQNVEESDDVASLERFTQTEVQTPVFEEQTKTEPVNSSEEIQGPDFSRPEDPFSEPDFGSASGAFASTDFNEPPEPEQEFTQPEITEETEEEEQDSQEQAFSFDEFEEKLKNIKNSWESPEEETEEPVTLDEEINIDELHKEFSFLNEASAPHLALDADEEIKTEEEPLPFEIPIEIQGEAEEPAAEINAPIQRQTDIPEAGESVSDVNDDEIKTDFSFASFKNVEQNGGYSSENSSDSSVEPDADLGDENLAEFGSWDFSGNITDDEKNDIDKLINIDAPEKFADIELELSSPSEFNEFEGIKDIESFPIPPEIADKLEKELAEAELTEKSESEIPGGEPDFLNEEVPGEAELLENNFEIPAEISDTAISTETPGADEANDVLQEPGDLLPDMELPPIPAEAMEENIPETPAENGAEAEFSEVERLIPEIPIQLEELIADNSLQGEQAPQEQKTGLTAEQLRLIVEAAEKVNSNIKLDDVLNSIVDVASELTSADRGTLYLIDEEQRELWSKVTQGLEAKEIRLKIGQGLAGHAADTNEIINIPDASLDERFNPGFDMATGYTTKSVLCFPIKNRDGRAVGVLQLINSKNGTFSQLDEQFLEALSINAAIALENAELVEQLLRTDRLTSLGKMANFILQDIKKPIITIKHFAEHIKKKPVPPDIKQVLEMQIEQANSVVNLVQTTLSYSEGKSILQTQMQSLNQALDTILLMLAEYVESQKVKLFKKYDKDALVSIDKNEFYQACYQVTKNACEAMPNGGNLYFATLINEENNTVEISIRDTGLGIPDSIKERIFEPFMSHGKKQGTGLGLSITEKIIKDHRGSITAESNLGEGSTFFITLPISRRL